MSRKNKHRRRNLPPFVQSDIKAHPESLHLWCDGSFRPPDNAGYSYLIFSEKTKHIVKMEQVASRGSTINQMELSAINASLDYPRIQHAVIYSDSAYCIMSLSQWRYTWEKNDWLTPLNEPIKNKDLIQEIGAKLDALKSFHFVKITSHSGVPFNSVVDCLASGLTAKMVNNPLITNQRFTLCP